MNWNKLSAWVRYPVATALTISGCIVFMTGTISGIRGCGFMIIPGILSMKKTSDKPMFHKFD